MKKYSYRGPLLTLIVGGVVFLVLLFLTISNISFVSNYHLIDENNNIIEFKEEGTVEMYINGVTDYTYSIEKVDQNTYTIIVNEGVIEEARFNMVFVPEPDVEYEFNIILDEEDLFVTKLLDITSDQESVLIVDIVHVDGDSELMPFVMVDESAFAEENPYYLVFGIYGTLYLMTTLIYFIVIYNKRAKNRPKKEVQRGYQRTTLFIDPLEDLINTDKAFSEESQTEKTAAWLKYTTPFATMGTDKDNPFIRGHQEIEENISKLYQMENLNFRWKPTMGFVSDDGTLGVTIGLYKRSFLHEGQTIEQKGKYISVWRNYNGKWRIVYDMGN